MRVPRFITADELMVPGGDVAGVVIDLDEYAHPSARAAALDRLAAPRPDASSAPLAVILPPDAASAEVEAAARTGAGNIVVNDAESAVQLKQAGDLLDRSGATAVLVARMTGGRGLYAARDLAGAHRRVAGLWYAAADLLVDFDDDPPMAYYFDAGESRLAAPGWTRSMLLTVARAAGIALWGQFDLSFAEPAPAGARERVARLARLSGFDVVVARHT